MLKFKEFELDISAPDGVDIIINTIRQEMQRYTVNFPQSYTPVFGVTPESRLLPLQELRIAPCVVT